MSDLELSGVRAAGVWFVAAGLLTLARGLIEFADPAYWNPVTVVDHAAVWLTTVGSVIFGIALGVWWWATPIRRGSVLFLVAGVGAVVSGVGNALEDAFDVALGAGMWEIGGMTAAIALLGAALLAFTVKNRYRWLGFFFLGYLAGSTFPDDGGEIVSALSVLALGIWLARSTHPPTPADQSASAVIDDAS